MRIGIVGDFDAQRAAHLAIPRALAAAEEPSVEAVWIPTESVGREPLADFDGFWCAPGIPYRDDAGAQRAIRYARTNGTPFLGTSGGFQYALLEYARECLGLSLADHQKTNPAAAMPLIAPLSCALAGVRARVRLMHGSKIRAAYGAPETVEEYHCSFGLNNRYRRLLAGGDLYVGAIDDQDEIHAVELDGHPFFVATLFQPELRSLAEGSPPSPLVNAFVAACRAAAGRPAAQTAG
jgi:CTP synthase (UTP-ammonia lyase)